MSHVLSGHFRFRFFLQSLQHVQRNVLLVHCRHRLEGFGRLITSSSGQEPPRALGSETESKSVDVQKRPSSERRRPV